jgi:hypothetical protein
MRSKMVKRSKLAAQLLLSLKRSGTFRLIDVLLWWVLISLVAISLVADHPMIALSIALAGGTMIGILCVIGSSPR